MKREEKKSSENLEFAMEFGDINADKFFEIPSNRKEEENKKTQTKNK